MTDFEIKDVEKYKIIDNKLVDLVTSDVIYTIDKSRQVICHTLFCINDVNYFMIHYRRYHEICYRVTINLNSRQIYTKDDVTVYLKKPILVYKDGDILFKGAWVMDDLLGDFRVEINPDCGLEISNRISTDEDSDTETGL